MKWKIRRTIGILLLVLAATSCGVPDIPSKEGYQFEDALGRTVQVEQPQRVVALMGGFADTWLLAGGELTGVTIDALEERELNLPETVAVVGSYNAPNIEAILALQPDFVILSAQTPAHVELQAVLEQTGITAAYFDVAHFDDYLEMLHICTEITGREDLFRKNGLAIQDEIKGILNKVPKESPPSVLLMVTYSGGVAVQRSDSMAGRMLDELGCEMIVERSPSLLKEFSLEAVIAEDPDYIFVISMGNSSELAHKNLYETLESNPAWRELTAVREDRYHILPKELFLYKPNVQWTQAYQIMADLLYAE